MKQQEILRKIGNILKELNEQYDYLHAEEAHLNDLELELFAANAKFLTDHTEILRKINAQNQNATLSLPPHTGHEATHFATSSIDILPPLPSPETEVSLPPLAQSTITFSGANIEQQPETATPVEENLHYAFNPVAQNQPEPQNTVEQVNTYEDFKPESEDYITDSLSADTTKEEPVQNTTEDTAFEPLTQQDKDENIAVQDYTFMVTRPDPLEEETDEQQHEHSVSIDTIENAQYDFIRHAPQVSNEQHTFSISSDTEEEPAPPHVDLTPAEAEPIEAQPVFTHEVHSYSQQEYAEPVNIAPTEPEPVIPAPTEQERSIFIPETYQKVDEEKQPVTNAPQSEPEQPLTLNQRLSAQLHPQTPAHVQQGPAVTDIKAAISLNDKLLFVKDLFNGYGMAYTEAIELVNRCKSFDEADRFLKSNYVVKNSWGDKPNTVDKFYAILHRRFTS